MTTDVCSHSYNMSRRLKPTETDSWLQGLGERKQDVTANGPMFLWDGGNVLEVDTGDVTQHCECTKCH